MNNRFIKLSNLFEKKLIVLGSSGVALVEGTGRFIENNLESRDIIIEKNTNVTISSFDLYTDKVILTCTKNKSQYSVSVTYEFILNNCKIENKDKNRVVDAVYAVQSITNVVDTNTLIYTIISGLIFLGGLLLGKM